MKWAGRTFRWLKRFRKRRGYGVHSPFAFNLITGVFFEKEAYYAYAPLAAWRKGRTTAPERNDRLLFRLINDHRPASCLILGEGAEVAAAYLKAGCKTCAFVEAAAPDEVGRQTFDMCYVASPDRLADWLPAVLPLLSRRALLVAKEACASKTARAAWRAFTAHEKVRVSFDLYEFGLAYTEERLNKQDYIINYP